MTEQGSLVCRKCEVPKPVDEFKAKSGSIYQTFWCRPCRRQYDRDRYKVNPEPKKAASTAWIRANPERHNENTKSWASRNRHKTKAQIAAWLERNPDWSRVKQQRRKARLLGNGGELSLADWESIKAYYDHTCLGCGKEEPETDLTIDHVIPLFMGGRNDAGNIQPLCRVCNSKKGHRNTTDFRKGAAYASEDRTPELSASCAIAA
jgi:5-methylcytosine-specific restriction endonuclease McrA